MQSTMRAKSSLLALVLFLLAAPATAQSEDHRAQDIARNTMSPFCPGRTLATCSSERAGEWRQEIEQWVAQGVSTEEIRRRLEARGGGDLSGQPTAPLGWLTPVLITAGAAGLLVWLLRRLAVHKGAAASSGTAEPSPRGLDPKVEARLDEELRQLDE